MPFFDKYPYTNFHNVNLDWVLERVKEWGALVEQNNTAFHELEEANEAFKNYVTSYFENLDVQEEINNKLDSMLESGVLTEYLQPYVSPAVSEWLSENITEPTGVVIDKSLTVDGACADSKVTGDNINAMLSLISLNKVAGWWTNDAYIGTNASPVNLTEVANNEFRYLILNCKENDIFYLNGLGGVVPRFYCFIDENNNILLNCERDFLANNTKVIAPKNSSKLIINDKKTNGIILWRIENRFNR